ncbi:AAA family ATPase [Vibrio parahaemolyticus]|uniref:AAA family ATPase n=1 Tax=Vibrio parahaemolyticus TaxID=670 RepID=UPI00101EEF0A|nr:ATP-binding protein [Vibrio parahaemolyticus]
MLQAIEIKNFKSIEDLQLKFGRVNLFIGENGSGKSTILEALTFAAASEADKLDAEFLENRGIRVTTPKLMRSNFSQEHLEDPISIKICIDSDGSGRKYLINNDNDTYSEWKLQTDTTVTSDEVTVSTQEFNQTFERYKKIMEFVSSNAFESLKDRFSDDHELSKVLANLEDQGLENKFSNLSESLKDVESSVSEELSSLKNFVIYSPQNKQLRNLKEEGAIRPVGIHGEGLFKLLREIHEKQPDAMQDIEKGLALISWYKSMDLDNEPELIEDELFIQDKYLPVQLTQRSANEGFLYVLFYMAIIVSKNTPRIFAIDNIDAALNPKLCAKIMSYLVELAIKYDKQLFLTTQNPATLDGINVFEDDQKLFVVSRKKKGQTTARQFTSDNMPKTENGELILLSEAMIKGFIGAIPRGF